MSNFIFSTEIPNELKILVENNIRSLCTNTGLIRKDFIIEPFQVDDEVESEKLIIKTETTVNGKNKSESFFLLLNALSPNIVEFAFNTNYFYSPKRYMQDFENIDEIKHNALVLLNKIVDIVKDKKGFIISLSSYYKNRELAHKIIIQKEGKTLNNIDITEKDAEHYLTKGFATFLMKYKMENLVSE